MFKCAIPVFHSKNNGSHQICVRMQTVIGVKKYQLLPFSSVREENCGSELELAPGLGGLSDLVEILEAWEESNCSLA